MMRKYVMNGISIFAAFLILPSSGFAKSPTVLPLPGVIMGEDTGCKIGDMAHFGRYIGDWKIQDWQLQKDGSWVEQKGARWIFKCVGNGVAVQDYWLPSGGGVGTNLRIYDPKEKLWKIVWTATGAPGETRISAKKDVQTDAVIMHVTPVPGKPRRRITFFPPTSDGWDWAMDFSKDEGQTWRTVYKIKATPYGLKSTPKTSP